MSLDPATPVLVGAGQLTGHLQPDGDHFDWGAATEPVAMMGEVARRAADDAGPGAALLARTTGLFVVDTALWRYRDPAALVAAELDIEPRQCLVSTVGGNTPQMFVNRAATAIARGD